jgi:hypothetical protein
MNARRLPPPPLSAEDRRAEINRRWFFIERKLERRRKRRSGSRPSLATLRVYELSKLYYARYGSPRLPDDDAGRDDAMIMINHLIMLADGPLRVRDWCRRYAPWFVAEAENLVERLIVRPRRYTADTLGRLLNLTIAERDRLQIRTIGAVDLDKAGRRQRRREKDRLVKEAKRRAGGTTPRAQSASRTKPWDIAGVSRSKWYADRRAAREAETILDCGQFRRQYDSSSTVDEIVQPTRLAQRDEARR